MLPQFKLLSPPQLPTWSARFPPLEENVLDSAQKSTTMTTTAWIGTMTPTCTPLRMMTRIMTTRYGWHLKPVLFLIRQITSIQYPEKEDGWNYAGTNQRLKKDRIGGGGGGGRRPRWQRRRPFRRHHAPGLWVVSLDWLWRALNLYPTIIMFYVEFKTFHIVIFCEIHVYVWYTNKTFNEDTTCLGVFEGRQV